MKDDYTDDEDLKGIAPNLFKMEKKKPFSVPENYFDSLPGLIQEKIQKKKPETLVEIFFHWFAKPQLVFAVIILSVLLIGGVYFFKSDVNKEQNIEFAISDDDFNGSVLMDQVDENLLLDEVTALNDKPDQQPSPDADIENYLIDNQADLNQIINAL